MRIVSLCCLLLCLLPARVWGAPPSPKTSGVTHPVVSVTSSTSGVAACPSNTDGVTVCVPTGGVTIWLDLVNTGGTCAASLTARNGIPITPGQCYICATEELGGFCWNWVGLVCLILDSGSTAVTPLVTCR